MSLWTSCSYAKPFSASAYRQVVSHSLWGVVERSNADKYFFFFFRLTHLWYSKNGRIALGNCWGFLYCDDCDVEQSYITTYTCNMNFKNSSFIKCTVNACLLFCIFVFPSFNEPVWCLQADQLTEEQIAGKTLLHWSPTFFTSHKMDRIMDTRLVDLHFCLLGHWWWRQRIGHKTGKNETAVAGSRK